MPGKVIIVGVGPGNPNLATMRALQAVETSATVVGSRRLLGDFARPGQQQIIIGRDLEQLSHEIVERSNADRQVAVLVSGDTGIFSLASFLAERLEPELMEWIPGVSPVQYLFAHLQLSWEEAAMVSLHGRDAANLEEIVTNNRHTVIWTDPVKTPGMIANRLIEAGVPDLPVVIGENLSYSGETIVRGNLGSLARQGALPVKFESAAADANAGAVAGAGEGNSIMVIFNEFV